MVFFEYDAQILPQITLIGTNLTNAPHRNLRRVSSDYIYYLITEGEMYFCEGEKIYRLQKGDCFLFEPEMLHFGTQDSRFQFRYIHFRHPTIESRVIAEQEWLTKARQENKAWLTSIEKSALPESRIFLPKIVHFQDMLTFSNIIAMVDKAIERQSIRLEHYNTLCACAVQEIFIEIYRQFVLSSLQKANRGAESTYRINEVITYLNANYARKLTGDIIEKELSYNFDYLNQLFRKHLDTSIFQMLETIRMETARSLIQTSGLSMERIANKVGFKDETYFSKVFKKRTGLSPLQYRQSMQKQRF